MTKKTNGAALHTIEESHGKPRLTNARLTDIETVETAGERLEDHDAKGRFTHRNRAAADSSAKRALTQPLRAARQRLREALEGVEPSAADALLAPAMSVYQSASRELASRSIFVTSALVSFAVNGVLESHYITRAAEAGLETELGMQLIELAHSCSKQAKQAMTAALAALKALSGRKPARNLVLEAIDAAGKVAK
jgi:hypothetical protein